MPEKTGEHCEMRRGDNGNTDVTLNLSAEGALTTDAAIADANSRFKKTCRPAMIEMRICWSKPISLTKMSGGEGGLWIPETPKNRDDLEAYVEAGNQSYGSSTHWIDRREA